MQPIARWKRASPMAMPTGCGRRWSPCPELLTARRNHPGPGRHAHRAVAVMGGEHPEELAADLIEHGCRLILERVLERHCVEHEVHRLLGSGAIAADQLLAAPEIEFDRAE